MVWLILVTLSLASTCSSSRSTSNDEASRRGTESGPIAEDDSLRLTLFSSDTVVLGESLNYELHLENMADRTLAVVYSSSPITHDLIVLDDAGNEVWRRLGGGGFMAASEMNATLKPGRHLSFIGAWGLVDSEGRRVDAGSYQLKGIFHHDYADVRESQVKRLTILSAADSKPNE